jgi:hypothetical protein
VATRADIRLKPAPGLTSEEARDARVRAWAFIFESFHRRNVKEAIGGDGPDEGERSLDEFASRRILPKRAGRAGPSA